MSLVTFTTKNYPNISMFGDVAKSLLKMMGHSATVPGAILAADVPTALSRLKTAIDAAKALQPDDDRHDDPDEEEPPVSIAIRAFPLIELLDAAVKANANVMWE